MKAEKLRKATGPDWREWAEKRTWRNLTQLKNHIELHDLEKVKSFNGAELVTDKAFYELSDGKIRIFPN